MKRLTFLVLAVGAFASIGAFKARAFRLAAQADVPVFATEMPAGYRELRFISVAHEEGNLNSFASVFGNEVAISAYREGKPPFPDGAIIAALHYHFVPSAENNKGFGRDQSFVAGAPTNAKFRVKDSRKYAATGGWGSVISITTVSRSMTRS